ncbi:hypothetical protein F4778DRAFT_123888 [Xylariomycetidae sp. FL2044]|nr:hypothetical protein F4778DRAFT_123888 [Xylariomycetidae sp. FL2044]
MYSPGEYICPVRVCKVCDQSGAEVYNLGWSCLHPDRNQFEQFGSLRTGGLLQYNEAFLNKRAHFTPGVHPKMDYDGALIPALPHSRPGVSGSKSRGYEARWTMIPMKIIFFNVVAVPSLCESQNQRDARIISRGHDYRAKLITPSPAFRAIVMTTRNKAPRSGNRIRGRDGRVAEPAGRPDRRAVEAARLPRQRRARLEGFKKGLKRIDHRKFQSLQLVGQLGISERHTALLTRAWVGDL